VLLVASACSVSLPQSIGAGELLLGRSVVSASGESERRIVPGLDLRLLGPRTASSGITMGWSDVQLAIPGPRAKHASASAPTSWRYRPPLGFERIDRDGNTDRLGWLALRGRPPNAETMLSRFFELGLMLRWGRLDRGLGVGIGRGVTVVANPEVSALYGIQCASSRSMPCEFLILNWEDDQ
jgi:hypothetical protein